MADYMDILFPPKKPPSQQHSRLQPGHTSELLDTIVIGAGWAGLGAARALQEHGQNFVVLEARDYVGGRSHTIELDDSLVELGSQWIHGNNKQKNPISKLVQHFQTPTLKAGESEGGVWSKEFQSHDKPRRIPYADLKKVRSKVFSDGWYSFMEKYQDADDDQSLRKTTDMFITKKHLDHDDRRVLEYCLHSNITTEYAASLQDISTYWWDNDSSMGGSDAVIKPGYSHLVEQYASSFRDRIYLHSPVTDIDWSDHGNIKVTYLHGATKSTVKARHVIVTVPLGVLQAKTIVFHPSLPASKQKAIQRLGVGLLDKVILKWDKHENLPWPKNVEWVEKMATPQERWTEFYNFQPVTGDNILVAFTAGRDAGRIERLDDDNVLEEVLLSLKEMFDTDIPDPAAFTVTRWSADEYARGSYSFYKVGSEPEDRKNLRAPLDNRLFFAGEACSMKYPSTTHGALLTGLEMGTKAAGKK